VPPSPILRTAKLDPRLRVTIVDRRPLHYAAGADPSLDRPAHVRAGSSLAWIGARLALIQDDANFLALVDPATAEVEGVTLPAGKGGVRLFDKLRGNKKKKLDLEACVVVETPQGPLFLAFGSGSTEKREKVLMIRGLGTVDPRIELIKAERFYHELRKAPGLAPGRLNLEGVAQLGGTLRFFSRGNGKERDGERPVNATCDIELAALLLYLDSPEEGPPVPAAVTQYDLGELDGVPLGFTDAAHLGGGVIYSAAAEASPDAVEDGGVTGSAIGIIDSAGKGRWAPILEQGGRPFAGKVEGLVLARTEGRLYVVVDADDPETASELCTIAVEGL
jgi:hypothetical protein